MRALVYEHNALNILLLTSSYVLHAPGGKEHRVWSYCMTVLFWNSWEILEIFNREYHLSFTLLFSSLMSVQEYSRSICLLTYLYVGISVLLVLQLHAMGWGYKCENLEINKRTSCLAFIYPLSSDRITSPAGSSSVLTPWSDMRCICAWHLTQLTCMPVQIVGVCAICCWMGQEVFKRVNDMYAVAAQPCFGEKRTEAL